MPLSCLNYIFYQSPSLPSLVTKPPGTCINFSIRTHQEVQCLRVRDFSGIFCLRILHLPGRWCPDTRCPPGSQRVFCPQTPPWAAAGRTPPHWSWGTSPPPGRSCGSAGTGGHWLLPQCQVKKAMKQNYSNFKLWIKPCCMIWWKEFSNKGFT